MIVISDTEAGDSEEAVLNSNEEVGGSMPPQEVDSEKGAVSAAISVNHSTERLPTFQKV